MKRLFSITTIVVLCSALFFVVVCAGADPVVPFKGSWSGGSTFYFPSNCPADKPLLAITTAKGVATLTGASKMDATYCCNPSTGYCEGTSKITAANGDEIHLSVVHNFNPLSGDWTQDEVITGGTGRFKGATGESMSSGTSTLTGPTTDTWQGTNVGTLEFSF